jgi:hypothetical protein
MPRSPRLRSVAALALACALAFPAAAQVQIGIDDTDPWSGSPNAFPFNVTGGQTSLHVYSAAALRERGVCAGSVLLGVDVAPANTLSGTYSAPQAILQVGHLAVSPPAPSNWPGHLASPVVMHDLTSGPYTFPWVGGAWSPLPGFLNATFVWDGVRDVGIQYSSSAGVTGGFALRNSATQLRHYVAVFNALAQPPTSNGLFAMKLRMTWVTPGCAAREVYGAGCDAPALSLAADLPVSGGTFTLTVANVQPVLPLAALLFGDAQAPGLDLGPAGAPGCRAWTNANLTSLTVPVVGGSGALALGVPASPGLLGAVFTTQAAGFTAANALGVATSNGLQWTIGY